MQAFLAEVSQIWSNGGTCSQVCMHTAHALTQCHNAVAAELLAADGDAQSLERWTFFISDGDKHHCVQLASRHGVVDVEWSITQHTAEQETGAPMIHPHPEHAHMLQQEAHTHQRMLQHETQQMVVRGAWAAQMILDQHPNLYAALTLAHIHVPGCDKPLQFHMWRTDVVARVQSQLGLPDAASVPLKVWARLRRTSYAGVINLSVLPCRPMFVNLICWQCGAMPAYLKQCGRCCMAWYCSRDCQRAQHSSHKRWCSGVADEMRQPPPLEQSPQMQCCTNDMRAALQRNSEAVALCDSMQQAVAQPAAGGSTAVSASASGAVA